MSNRQILVLLTALLVRHFSGWKGRVLIFSVAMFLVVVVAVGMKGKGFDQDVGVRPPRAYEAHYTSAKLVVDGKAEEAAWQEVPFSDKFVDIEGVKSPRYDTRMKMLWDEHYLYFYAEMEEPHVWGTLKERDTVIFYNNDFEIFIDPDGDTHEYYEFEMNALNTVWDLLLVKPYRNGGSVIDHWDINGLRSAVHIQGTLNDPTDADKGWSVEVAIPWGVLAEAAHMPVPPEGKFWRINFSRVNWDFDLEDGKYSRKRDGQGNYAPEYNWVWSPQQVVNMHEPERWGYVYFKPAGEESAFVIPENERLKWELYAVYRQLRGNGHRLLEEVREGKATAPSFLYHDLQMQPEVEFHRLGWNLVLLDPSENGVHVIREDGKYIFKN